MFSAYWAMYPQALEQQRGQDAFFVRRESVERPLPRFLSERLRSGPPFGVLDDQVAIHEALHAHGWSQAQVDQLWRDLQREADVQAERANYEYVNWRVGMVGQFLSNTSLFTVVGNWLASSEHSSIRGTLNGGGDFIRWSAPRGPRLVMASFPAAPPAPALEEQVVLQLPSGTLSSDTTARIVSDLSWNGVAAISVVEGDARVRERSSGREQRVDAGRHGQGEAGKRIAGLVHRTVAPVGPTRADAATTGVPVLSARPAAPPPDGTMGA